jgi:phospholipid/cholesterol/gamma-HCH transport system ATP-binding protein
MRRRVGFARAIAMKPEILLFDEPNTGLDPITSAVIDGVIVEMREHLPVTMVTITHDMKSAFRIADRVAMLRDGRIIAAATPDEFRKIPDPYVQKFLAGEPLEEEVA